MSHSDATGPSGQTFFSMPTSAELMAQLGVDQALLAQLVAAAQADGRAAELQPQNAEPALVAALLSATHQHKKGGLYAYVGELPIPITIGEQRLIITHTVYWHLWPFQRKLHSRPVFEFNQTDRFRPLNRMLASLAISA